MQYTLTGDLVGTSTNENTIETSLVGIKGKALPETLTNGALKYNGTSWEISPNDLFKHMFIAQGGPISTTQYTNWTRASSYSELKDISNMFNTSNGIYTIAETGVYQCNMWISMSSSSGRTLIGLFKNGVQIDEFLDIPNSTYVDMSSSKCYSFKAGDYIEFLRYTSSPTVEYAQISAFKIA